MNADEFATKYLDKIVRYRGNHYKIPTDVQYQVTAALFKYDDDGCSIFAIMSEKYNPPKNVDWFTIHVADEDLKYLEDFEIVGEGKNLIDKSPEFGKLLERLKRNDL